MQWPWGRREVDGFKLCQSRLGPRMAASFPVGCGSCWRQGDGLASCSLRVHVARAMPMGLTRVCLAPLSPAHRHDPKEAGTRHCSASPCSLWSVSCLDKMYQFSCLHKHTMYFSQSAFCFSVRINRPLHTSAVHGRRLCIYSVVIRVSRFWVGVFCFCNFCSEL